MRAAAEGDQFGGDGAVRLLLLRGAAVDEADDAGATFLHRAAMYGRSTVVETLVSSGAVVDRRTTERPPLSSVRRARTLFECFCTLVRTSILEPGMDRRL